MQNQDNTTYAVALSELRHILEDNKTEKLPTHGEFFYYFGLGQVNRAMPHQDPDWKGFGEKGDKFCERMFILGNDFDAITTIMHKIAWLTSQWQEQQFSQDHWHAYVKTDFHAFHAEIRSMFDSIAKTISDSTTKSNQLKDTYSKLRTQCRSDPGRVQNLIGKDLTDFISAGDWFEESRSLRDSIIHYEKDVQISYAPSSTGIKAAFRTVVGTKPVCCYRGPEAFKLQDDWILLQPYLGYYFGRFWFLLNQICKLIGSNLSLTKSGFSWVHPRLDAALDMIEESIARLDASSSEISGCGVDK